MALSAKPKNFLLMNLLLCSCVLCSLLFAPCSLLFDHFVRSRQHIRWNRQADLLGGFQIDHQLKLCRPLDRQVTWLCAFQNLVHVGGDSAIEFGSIRPIGYEATVFCPNRIEANGWQSILRRQIINALSMRRSEEHTSELQS